MKKRKLVFYSDLILPQNNKINQRLLELIAKPNARVGYISSGNDPTEKWFQGCKHYYSQFGVDLVMKIEPQDANNSGKVEELFRCDAIHLSGGSTYAFLGWIKESGLFDRLNLFAKEGNVLIGVSAGAILMTPDIQTSALVGDRFVNKNQDIISLGLVDFAFVPHFGRFGTNFTGLEAYSQEHQMDVYACPDGTGIVVENEKIECIGEISIAHYGK